MKTADSVKPVSKADAARAKPVTRGAVTLACRPGGPLEPALLDGGRLNAAHPAYVRWLSGTGPKGGAVRAPTADAKSAPVASSAPMSSRKTEPRDGAAPTAHRPGRRDPGGQASIAELESYADLLRPLIDRFGTKRNFRDWLLAQKDIETILQRHLDNEEAQGRLIARELVKVHLFGALDGLVRRLLRDSPKTIARRIYSLAKSGGGIEEAERIVHENLSSQIKPMKANAIRVLRDA